MRLLPVLTLLCLPTAAQAEWPAGQPIDDALMVDVTEQGFVTISETLPELVPSEIDVPDVRQSWSLLSSFRDSCAVRTRPRSALSPAFRRW